jgi:hypothetical protein
MFSPLAVRRAPSSLRPIHSEVFVWQELTLLLSYEADWMGLAAAWLQPARARLELQVLVPRGAPSPLSDDFGYWSDFLSPHELSPHEAIEAGGPMALAVALLNEFADTQTWRVSWARWELAQA